MGLCLGRALPDFSFAFTILYATQKVLREISKSDEDETHKACNESINIYIECNNFPITKYCQ